MIRFLYILILPFFTQLSKAQNLLVADTFTYTINLDLNKNLYLKSVPVELLKGYCSGSWNAYYPKREMNQCLFDDFLKRFNYYQLVVTSNFNFCFEDYCSNNYFTDMYKLFSRKLKYKEVIYFDKQHSVIKREVLWLQVFYSVEEYDGWKHYEGPIFWMLEIKKSAIGITVYNKDIRFDGWTLEKEFNHAGFIVNENKQKDDKKKLQKLLQVEEY